NAVDKIIGWTFMQRRLPLHGHLLLVSGRVSYEIVQKALSVGIPCIAAVSAPSSLAVKSAHEFGMTLIGFLRSGHYNIYCGAQRIVQHA
ncbi:MAG TPA: formate dehydrogenase accessory sulfurtransferase FdhD, partial [bacterium]|nr:formate dehydrogenase accessory sulfurtransferase FdhD [bacterium]